MFNGSVVRRLFVVAVTGASMLAPIGPADAACVAFNGANCGGSEGGSRFRGGGSGFGAAESEPPPRISIRNDSVGEGDTAASKLKFRVTLDHASSDVVKVKFATSPGSAASPSDYTDKAGTVTFQPGQTQKVVGVATAPDFLTEPDEEMFIGLSKPLNGKIARRDGTGTILNDDTGPPP